MVGGRLVRVCPKCNGPAWRHCETSPKCDLLTCNAPKSCGWGTYDGKRWVEPRVEPKWKSA